MSDRSGNYEEGDPRPALCARFGRFGVRARPAGRKKKRVVGGGDEWSVDVAEGPIRQVLISNLLDREMYGGGDYYVRRIDYLVPDSRIGPHFSKRCVHFVGVPFFGPHSSERRFEFVSVRSEESAEIIAESERNQSFLKMRVDPDRSCWVLTEGAWRESAPMGIIIDALKKYEPNLADAVAKRAPSREQWDGYQAIASQVLAAPELVADLVDRQPTKGVCAALRSLGVDARVMEQGPYSEEPGVRWIQRGLNPRVMKQDPFTQEPPARWVQIAGGPIRWVELGLGTLKPGAEFGLTSFISARSAGLGFGTLCYVPDARITPDSARVRMVSDRVKSFPVFGRVKRVRWYDVNLLDPGLDVPGHTQKDKDFSVFISESLGRDPAATEAIKTSGAELCVVADPDCGSWILAADDRPMTQWTRQLGDCCVAVAQSLLATPIPSVE